MPKKPEDMRVLNRTAPPRVFLNVSDEPGPFPGGAYGDPEVSWSPSPALAYAVEYKRADLVEEQLKGLRRKISALQLQVDSTRQSADHWMREAGKARLDKSVRGSVQADRIQTLEEALKTFVFPYQEAYSLTDAERQAVGRAALEPGLPGRNATKDPRA